MGKAILYSLCFICPQGGGYLSQVALKADSKIARDFFTRVHAVYSGVIQYFMYNIIVYLFKTKPRKKISSTRTGLS